MFCNFLHLHRFKSGRTSDNKGFSLIELMVAVGIIGIISAIAYPGLMRTKANYRTRGVASSIFSSFRVARTAAVKRNASVCLNFDQAGGTYLAFLDDGAGTPANADNCTQDASELTLFSKNVEPGTSLVADFSAGFNSRGRPLNNVIGNVAVQNDMNPQLQYRNTLSLAGRVDIQVTVDGGTTWN